MIPTVDTVTAVLAAYDHANQPSGLTARQQQVLRLVACGLSNVEIAGRLYVAVDTVKGDLRAMFSALGARNRAHAVALVIRAGIIR